MLRRLRRGSKDSGIEIPPSPKHDSLATSPSYAAAADTAKKTFFDLPAEIRNVIYEIVSTTTTLTLRKPQKLQPPVCGLLLASKQCRKEYLPLLYSTAKVIVEIKDFEFHGLIRVVASLYSTELKALRENRNLIIRLRTQNCAKENVMTLHRWLVCRADSLDRLPWRYEAVVAEPTSRVGCYRQARELAFYAERLARRQMRMEETLQWELQAIIAAFERKVLELDSFLKDPRQVGVADPRDTRGLSGGGVR